MKNSTRQFLIAWASIVMSLAATAGIFDESAFWVRGFRDLDGNGQIASGVEVPDARQANVSVGVTEYGYPDKRVGRTETVSCPYSGETFTAPCCYLNPELKDELYYCGSFGITDAERISVTNGVSTVVARVRPELGLKETSWLTGGIGSQLGFYKTADGRLCLYVGISRDAGYKTVDTTDGTFTIEPGQWIDIALTRDAESVKLYAATNGFTFSKSFAASVSNDVFNTFYFGHFQTTRSATAKNPYTTTFRGSIQQIAVWNRCLTEAEVREAFAFPCCDIFRAGLANGSSAEFGRAAPAESAVSPHDWYEIPAALADGSTLQLAFVVPARLAGLKQYLRVTPTADSEAGALTATIDGVNLPTLATVPAETAMVPIPPDVLTAGEHTLTLTRQKGMTKFDVLSLGGSVQLGIENNSNGEFGIKGNGAPISSYLEDCNTTNSAHVIEQSTTNEWKIVLPTDLPASCRWTYEVRASTGKTLANYTEPLRVALLVNGQSVKTDSFTARTQNFSVNLPAGALRAGENVLGFTNLMLPTQKGYYINLDCVRLTNTGTPNGLLLLVK